MQYTATGVELRIESQVHKLDAKVEALDAKLSSLLDALLTGPFANVTPRPREQPSRLPPLISAPSAAEQLSLSPSAADVYLSGIEQGHPERRVFGRWQDRIFEAAASSPGSTSQVYLSG